MPTRTTGSKLTLRMLLDSTYRFMHSRFDNAERDFLKLLRIEKVFTYDGKNPRSPMTKFVVTSQSTPQYRPYFTGKDSRGRPRQFQRKIKHQYDVTLQLDRLSIDAPVKYRTGSDRKMLFGPNVKAQYTPAKKQIIKNGKIVQRAKPGTLIRDDLNVLRGRNGDFFFRLEWVLQENGALFGRNWAGWPPVKTNPHKIPYLDKHALTVVLTLIKKGKIKL